MSKRLRPGEWSDRTITHGTPYAYDKCGCRCSDCVVAYRAYRRDKREQRATRATEIPHGHIGYVGWLCRCEVCRKANTSVTQIYRTRHNEAARVDARHHAEEWTGPQLEIALRDDLTARQAATMLGRTVMAVQNIRNKRETPKIAWLLGASRNASQQQEAARLTTARGGRVRRADRVKRNG
jgi:hypothetical protein